MSSAAANLNPVNHQTHASASMANAAGKEAAALKHAQKPTPAAPHDKAAVGALGTKVDTSA